MVACIVGSIQHCCGGPQLLHATSSISHSFSLFNSDHGRFRSPIRIRSRQARKMKTSAASIPVVGGSQLLTSDSLIFYIWPLLGYLLRVPPSIGRSVYLPDVLPIQSPPSCLHTCIIHVAAIRLQEGRGPARGVASQLPPHLLPCKS